MRNSPVYNKMRITSPDNPRVKYLWRLHRNASFRQREKKFLIEGTAAIKGILQSRHIPEMLFVCPELLKDPQEITEIAYRYSIPITELSARCFKKITDVRTPQGVAVLFSFLHFEPAGIFRNRRAIILCCAGVQDPGNLGTLLRTADAAGASAIITLPPSVSFYNPKVVRASAGSILNVPHLSMSETEFVRRIEECGIKVFAATPRGGTPFERIQFEPPMCIVIGSEAHGLPAVLREISQCVTIPMRKGVESLNAAVAGSLLLYCAIYGKK